MELFDKNGCLTDEGLQALQAGGLDELGRLETAEHLSYCDKCMDRYTALLTADALETPPHSAHKAVMATIWVRLMQNTWGRAAVAAVAAVLVLTMWRSGTLKQILSTGETVRSWLPETTQTTEPEQLGRPVQDDERTPTQPEQLGKPIGSDSENGKTTFVTLYSAEGAMKLAHDLNQETCTELHRNFGEKAAFLEQLAQQLLVRKN